MTDQKFDASDLDEYQAAHPEPREHVKDADKYATVVPWHGTRNEAPDKTAMCDGELKTTQEAWADVTRCNKCKYYAYWGIGD